MKAITFIFTTIILFVGFAFSSITNADNNIDKQSVFYQFSTKNIDNNFTGNKDKTSYTKQISNMDAPKGDLYAGGEKGVYKSSDLGQTWQSFNTGKNGKVLNNVNAFLYVKNKLGEKILYAAANDGLYKRIIGIDKSWAAVGKGLPTGAVSLLAKDDYSNIFAVVNNTIYKSKDAGESWLPCAMEGGASKITSLLNGEKGVLYAGRGEYLSVLRSIDDGDTWKIVDSDPNLYYISDIIKINSTVYALSSGIMEPQPWIEESSDNGDKWRTLTYLPVDSGYGTKFINIGTTLYVGVDGSYSRSPTGIYKGTTNGGDFKYISQGPNAPVTSLINIDNIYLFASTKNNNSYYTTVDNDLVWKQVPGITGIHAFAWVSK